MNGQGWEAAALGSSGIPGGGSQDVMCRGMRVYSSDVHTVILLGPLECSIEWKRESGSSRALLCCYLVTQSCLTLWDPMDYSTRVSSLLHHLPGLAQTHVHWVSDAIQPSHPLSSPSPPAFSLSQHQGLFQWVGSSHQVQIVLELQLQHQSFQRIFRVDFL